MAAINISNNRQTRPGAKLKPAFGKPMLSEVLMSELENRLNRILEEHQHESGLHMIGGRRELLSRLVQFCEQELRPEWMEESHEQGHSIGRTA